MRWLKILWLAVVVSTSSLALQARADEGPHTRQLRVNDADVSYIAEGTGAPVLFVHGSGGDLRVWEPQRHAIATKYRFIAYNNRYHGTAPWTDEGKHYSAATDTADLAAFMRQLNASPVHLVASFYGGILAVLVASEHPDLVRSPTLLEPALGALLADIPEAKPLRDEWSQAFGHIRTTAKAGDAVQATKLLFDLLNNQGAGAFDKLPEAARQIRLDNARTVPLLVSAPPPPAISCATLSAVQAPTLVVGGAQSPRYFSLINEVVVRCIPGSGLVIIPQATHLISSQNPSAFNEALLQFLAQR